MSRPYAMRSRILVPLLALTLTLASILVLAFVFPAPAAADGIIIPEPPPDRRLTWRDVPLTVKYHRVEVVIADQVATTKVDQVFVNDAAYAVEGTYIFPLPDDAAISSFDMWVDGQKLEGRLLGRDEARAIYEDIVRRQRDPALLEYVGRGAFQASIFPIPPGGERRVELTYSQVLAQADGLVHYRYPLNTERFSSRPIGDVSVTVRLSDKTPIRAVYSPSHTIQVTRDGDYRATAGYEERNTRPDRDFDLYYSLSADAVAVNLLSYKPYDEDGFFLLLVAPRIEVTDAVVAKDVVLVLDISGSMAGDKMKQAQAAADYVLDHLGQNDRFNIVAFSTAPRLFSDRPIPASRRSEGHAFIAGLEAAGSTDINRALLEALAGADLERPTVLIFLTDGLPTAGETDPDRIAANIQDAAPKSVRLFSFGVGYDVDTVLLDQLSSGQRGTSAYVKPEQNIEEEVSGFYAKVSTPVLVDVAAAFSGVTIEDVYPYPLPDLFAGSQLIVAGRYARGGAADLTVRGQVNGAPRTYTYRDLTFVERGGQEFIARLWAQRKIGYLLAQIRLHGTQDELVKEVVALSTRYGIVTHYTSFLVQEPAGDMKPSVGGQAGQPTAAPAAQAPVPEPRSGQAAVEKSVAEQALKSADSAVAAAPAEVTQVMRQVGDKTFLLRDGAWVDTAYDAASGSAIGVPFGGEVYFTLLAGHPELGRYLALGDRVTVLLAGQAYSIAPGGTAQAAPAAPATVAVTPAASPAAPSGSPAPIATVEPAPTPAPAVASPTPSVPPTGQPICPAAAVIGLVGLGAPLSLARRRGR